MFDKYRELKDKSKTPVLSNIITEATENSPASDVIQMTYQSYDKDTGDPSLILGETMDTDELELHINALKTRLAAAREVYNLATGKIPN
jgi:hypothetical protein